MFANNELYNFLLSLPDNMKTHYYEILVTGCYNDSFFDKIETYINYCLNTFVLLPGCRLSMFLASLIYFLIVAPIVFMIILYIIIGIDELIKKLFKKEAIFINIFEKIFDFVPKIYDIIEYKYKSNRKLCIILAILILVLYTFVPCYKDFKVALSHITDYEYVWDCVNKDYVQRTFDDLIHLYQYVNEEHMTIEDAKKKLDWQHPDYSDY